ncbi:MAG: hypothetical protein K2K89_00030 [Ruminococcus sp.]|nr:hypothetical protein [Ruminococcus sp.]
MDYENIVEIVELERYSEVNKYLKCGWILLSASVAVAPGAYGVERDRIYSIGWNRKNGEVQYPVSEYSQVSEQSQKLQVAMEAASKGDYSAVNEFLAEWNFEK